MLQLRNDEAEDFVAGLLKLLDHFTLRIFRLVVLQHALDMRFDVGLLETVSVLLSLDVLALHLLAHALFLPIELKVDIAGYSSRG